MYSPAGVAATLAVLVSLAQSSPIRTIFKRGENPEDRVFSKFDYASSTVRGTSAGGWLLLEPWLTPSLFNDQPDWVVDEYTLCQNYAQQGSSCLDVLQPHWNTWITEADFQKMASVGLNHVRIPLGYWSVIPNPGDPYVQGAYEVLGQALDWAEQYGLKVMIDIHGAQSSQNGFDNSGHRGNIGFGIDDGTIPEFRAVFQTVLANYSSHPAVSTIEIINEPVASTIGEPVIEQLYRDSWGDVSVAPDPNIYTTFHDGFLGVNYWDKIFDSGMNGMLTDTHHYEIFDSGQLQMTPDQHNQAACAFGGQMAQNTRPTIAGEFTGALTDCALYLNGRGVGARYDGSYNVGSTGSSYIGSCEGKTQGNTADLSQTDKDNIRNFINAQLSAFEQKTGWIYWTWRTEGAPEWDMQMLLDNGLFPNPVSSRNGFTCS